MDRLLVIVSHLLDELAWCLVLLHQILTLELSLDQFRTVCHLDNLGGTKCFLRTAVKVSAESSQSLRLRWIMVDSCGFIATAVF